MTYTIKPIGLEANVKKASSRGVAYVWLRQHVQRSFAFRGWVYRNDKKQ